MGKKRGRKPAYEERIKPYLEQIKNAKKTGATDAQVMEMLGVSKTAFYEAATKYTEFREILKKGRADFAMELRGRLASLTEKHTLETKKQYIKEDQDTGAKIAYTEITTREIDPDPVAINMLLKNIDCENWSDNPQMLRLKQQEHQLRVSIAKSQNFDLEYEEKKK